MEKRFEHTVRGYPQCNGEESQKRTSLCILFTNRGYKIENFFKGKVSSVSECEEFFGLNSLVYCRLVYRIRYNFACIYNCYSQWDEIICKVTFELSKRFKCMDL